VSSKTGWNINVDRYILSASKRFLNTTQLNENVCVGSWNGNEPTGYGGFYKWGKCPNHPN
jgi:hypothetical protein